MTDEERALTPVDRGTLIVWRLSNIVGWGTAALAAGLMVGLVIVDLQYLLDRWVDFRHAFGALYVLGSSAVIGSIVGRRVYRSVELVAFVVAFVQLFSARFFDAGAYGWGSEGLLYALTHLVGSALFASMAWRRRPLAFRGGRGPVERTH